MVASEKQLVVSTKLALHKSWYILHINYVLM